MDNILNVKGLSRSYVGASGQEVAVLKDVHFAIGAGQMVGIYGSSGSGKSSFLNCLGLLDSFYCDSMVVNNIDVTHASERVKTTVRRENIGFIYQFHHLLRELTALENVVLPLLISERQGEQNRTRAVGLLASLGLEDRLLHQPDQLSGGEQQRVAIARALSNDPRLIVADEPTGNLDSESSHQVFRILKEVCVAKGIAVVVATHNMAMTSYMDRVYRIEDGGLVELVAGA